MKMTFAAIIAAFAIAFAACDGQQGRAGEPGPGSIPPPVTGIIVDGIVTLPLAGKITIAAEVSPDDAAFQTLRWELYDEVSAAVIGLGRIDSRLSVLTGSAIEVTGLSVGEARILVTAFGGVEPVSETVTVRVTGVRSRLAELREMHSAGELPGSVSIAVGAVDEPIDPQELYFGGESITISLTSAAAGGELYLVDGPGAMFTIGSGVTLDLSGVTLRGIDPNQSALVVVGDGGTLRMNAGTVITGNADTRNSADAFSTVGVGGVLVESNGTFEMTGGEIFGNSGALAGGGVMNWGTFTMSGGAIRDNDSIWGGGVRNQGFFHLLGGTIADNTATGQGGGVWSWNALLAMHDGATISGNASLIGGGVLNTGQFGIFDMFGGMISGNHSTGANVNDGGGGVRSENHAIFTMHPGAVISGNVSERNGGGVEIAGSTFRMRGGLISGNEAVAGDGGGVRNLGATFLMMNGIVHGTDDPENGNTAGGTGAAFTSGGAGVVSRHGTFAGDGEEFTPQGDLENVMDGTLWVVNGVLIPVQ